MYLWYTFQFKTWGGGQKSVNHFKILGAKKLTRNKFHNENPQKCLYLKSNPCLIGKNMFKVFTFEVNSQVISAVQKININPSISS